MSLTGQASWPHASLPETHVLSGESNIKFRLDPRSVETCPRHDEDQKVASFKPFVYLRRNRVAQFNLPRRVPRINAISPQITGELIHELTVLRGMADENLRGSRYGGGNWLWRRIQLCLYGCFAFGHSP